MQIFYGFLLKEYKEAQNIYFAACKLQDGYMEDSPSNEDEIYPIVPTLIPTSKIICKNGRLVFTVKLRNTIWKVQTNQFQKNDFSMS